MSVAFVTMVYGDEFFLSIWLGYYLKQTTPENIHIVTHGPQPYVSRMAPGCTIVECSRDPRNPQMDQDRFTFLSKYCTDLLSQYDRVIWNDVDEIVVLDPVIEMDLVEYLENLPAEREVVTPMGLEIVHRTDLENDYDYCRPMFAQRRFARFNAWYTKPNIISTPIVWGPDGHGSSYPRIFLDRNLFTFHLKWFDHSFHVDRHKERLGLRFNDDHGNEIIVGAGSWSWSELTYKIVSNSLLRQKIVDTEVSFDFNSHGDRIEQSFREGRTGMYKVSWFVDGTLHLIPERFAQVI